MALVISTTLGPITLALDDAKAPATAGHIRKLVADKLYDGCCFYRSDFVIQCGLTSHASGGAVANPHPDLAVNEAAAAKAAGGGGTLNTRGSAAVAHWDVPDCGNSEFFVNLKENAHLDEAYGGYAVFARVADDASFRVCDAIAKAVAAGDKVSSDSMTVQ